MNKNIRIILFVAIVLILIIAVLDKEKKQEQAQMILDYYLEKIELTDEEIERLDVNEDSELDLFDAVLIIKGE